MKKNFTLLVILITRCRFIISVFLVASTLFISSANGSPFYLEVRTGEDINGIWLVTGNEGGPINTLLSSDLTEVQPWGYKYEVSMLLDLLPVSYLNYYFEYEQRTIPASSVMTLTTRSFAVGKNYSLYYTDDYFHSDQLKFSDVTGPGIWDLLRETMFIFDRDASERYRWEQIYRGPNGQLYAFRDSYGPQLFLLSDLIAQGYALYNLSDFAPAAPVAGNISTTYDGNIHTGTATPPEGTSILWYDSDGNLTGPPSGSTAGIYTAWAESVNQYNVKSETRTQVTVNISKANQTIIWDDPDALMYGTLLGSTHLNASLTGVLGGASPGILTYNPGSGTFLNAGVHTLRVDAAETENYHSEFKEVIITIDRAPLTIETNDAIKYCGQTNPDFSVSYNSFIDGEDASVLEGTLEISSTANENSGIGTYSIIPSGLTSDNYNITFKSGILTINSVSIDASESSYTIPIGTLSINLSATVFNEDSMPVQGAKVSFTIENGDNLSTDYPPVFTGPDGIATLSIEGLATTVDVLRITAVAGSNCGSDATSVAYLPIYDPDGGFVTGGGWIDSPFGAFTADPSLVGKANFGFVSKYKKGSTIPDGNTEFQFKAGDLNFNSYMYDWLVIAGSKAKLKGEGTINGSGTYGFMISAIDGDRKDQGEDKFRIKIWEKASEAVVYDNQIEASDAADPNTVIGGGSIVIHTKDIFKSASVLEPEAKIVIYPNPFYNSIYVDLLSESSHEVIIEMVDMNGRVIEYMCTGIVKANIDHHFELNTKPDLNPGIYMLRIRNVDGEYLGREMILKQ